LQSEDLQPEDLPLKVAQRGIGDMVRAAKRDGIEWVFIDTAPNMSASVTEAIRAATLVVVPCRPGVFDLDAVKGTVDFARQMRKPYAVVINGAPPRRQDTESPMVTHARETLLGLNIPITQRANFMLALADGEGAREYEADSVAAAEIGRLWGAIEKSVKAIHGARDTAAMHRLAA
jgi:chromosome partitioning protein